jgi:hypothetical protein
MGEFGVPTLLEQAEGDTGCGAIRESQSGPARSENLGMCGIHAREPGLRHEALLCSDGGERPPSLGRRSGWVKLEAAGTGVPGKVGAASTKSGRPSTAGWVGAGERDGKVYERNRCCYAS